MSALTLALIARIPDHGVHAFQAYEAQVLPLLADHGGVLQRRLRTADATAEVHIVSFASRSGFESFRRDPRRTSAGPLLQASGATTEVLEVTDVMETGTGSP